MVSQLFEGIRNWLGPLGRRCNRGSVSGGVEVMGPGFRNRIDDAISTKLPDTVVLVDIHTR